jgi:hypothetical protein
MKTLKKLLSLLLCPLLLLPFCGCGTPQAETTPTETEPAMKVDPKTPVSDGKTLKMLCVTSSFGLNTTELLYDIAMAEGAEDVTVGRLYISGGTLAQHVNNALTQEPVYQYSKFSSKGYEVIKEAPLLQGLKDEEWDIIYLQQSAAQSGQEESYTSLIAPLLNYVKQNMPNLNARFVWNMTWAYQSDSVQSVFVNRFKSDQMYMYEQILAATKKHVEPQTEFSAIIPTGTAIQNARTSFFGDTLTKDTYHLNNLGRAIAGYTVYATLTGKELTEIHLENAWTQSLKTDLFLTEADKQVIMESVNNAIRNPHGVTQSKHPTK